MSSFQNRCFKSPCRFPRPQLLELQAEYHKNSHEFLSKNISELKESHSQTGEVTSFLSRPFTVPALGASLTSSLCFAAAWCRSAVGPLQPEGLRGASDVSPHSERQRNCGAHPGVHSHAAENGHERRGVAERWNLHVVQCSPVCTQNSAHLSFSSPTRPSGFVPSGSGSLGGEAAEDLLGPGSRGPQRVQHGPSRCGR